MSYSIMQEINRILLPCPDCAGLRAELKLRQEHIDALERVNADLINELDHPEESKLLDDVIDELKEAGEGLLLHAADQKYFPERTK